MDGQRIQQFTVSPNLLPANMAMWNGGCIRNASTVAPLVQRLKATKAKAPINQLLSTTH